MNNSNDSKKKLKAANESRLGAGMCIGLAIGLSLDKLLASNSLIYMTTGMCIGLVIALLINKQKNKQK